MTGAQLDAYIKALVDTAPPLSPDQLDRLHLLFATTPAQRLDVSPPITIPRSAP